MSRTTEYPNPEFAERLREAIWKSGLTYDALSKRIGRARSSTYRWIYCETYPDAGDLAKLCTLLHVSADWLLFGR